jgi:hypothetical protein
LCIPFGEFFLSLHLHTQLLSINPLISCTDWMGQQEELDVYAAMAYSLLDMLTQWNSWRPSDAVRERELCRAMRSGLPRFHAYCCALPLARLGTGHVDMEAAMARAHMQRYWWQMQLAAMYEVGNAVNSARCSAVSSYYDKRLRKLRRAKERDKASIDEMLWEKSQALAAVSEPLDELLPAVPDARDAAAVKYHQLARDELGHDWRCSSKLFHLVRAYGTGLLLLQATVIRVQRLYDLSDDEYAVLLALLRHCPRLGHFTRAVSATIEATCAGHANSEPQSLECLRDLVHERSHTALLRASAAASATLQALGW